MPALLRRLLTNGQVSSLVVILDLVRTFGLDALEHTFKLTDEQHIFVDSDQSFHPGFYRFYIILYWLRGTSKGMVPASRSLRARRFVT